MNTVQPTTQAPCVMEAHKGESWKYVLPQKGDHIRVKRRSLYYHHGIYVSDNEVIHFTGADGDSILDWSKCEVISTDLAQFSRGGRVEVREYTDAEVVDLYPAEHIVAYAKSCMGEKGYNLLFNNCEHFANMCTLGHFRSKQVEDVIKSKLGKNIGLFGALGGVLKNNISNANRCITTYEPDKVKIAEIECETKAKLAHMEQERIELLKSTRMDLLEFRTQSKIALEQARAQGLSVMAQIIVAMQDRLNEIAERRMLIIEKGSWQVVQDIEKFYDELSSKIKADNDDYNTEKLPELLAILDKYETGSSAHSIYMKRIEEDMALQTKHYLLQIDALANRQSQVIEGFLKSKERIIEQAGVITTGMIENITKQTLELDRANVVLNMPISSQVARLSEPNKTNNK